MGGICVDPSALAPPFSKWETLLSIAGFAVEIQGCLRKFPPLKKGEQGGFVKIKFFSVDTHAKSHKKSKNVLAQNFKNHRGSVS